jgi:hypothetical protein
MAKKIKVIRIDESRREEVLAMAKVIGQVALGCAQAHAEEHGCEFVESTSIAVAALASVIGKALQAITLSNDGEFPTAKFAREMEALINNYILASISQNIASQQ